MGKGGKCEGDEEDTKAGKRKREGNNKEEGMGFKDDEMRIFGDQCMGCFGFHEKGFYCREWTLKCTYPGCWDRRKPHPPRACFGMMKRCRLPACNNQRGHIQAAHSRLGHLSEADQVKRLKTAYDELKVHHTIWEKERIEEYEKELNDLTNATKRIRLDEPPNQD